MVKVCYSSRMTHPSTKRARRLRQEANLPEQKAWETLRQLRKEGWPVRRQVPIEGYTVDFAIRKLKLVIEIDGSIHDLPEVMAADHFRDEKLEAAGWRILRLPAKVALSPDHLIDAVRSKIRQLSCEK
ncbi:MAG: endonuclease domain-containing protein [Aquisalinus sp.]|nr:endonuclease domain-containing protein [Aquisalinus sp.]